jgi:SNF2 family DNA or RNA helicase
MRPSSDLRGYQQRLIKRMYESDSLLAMLKMGAGKTIAALTAIEELIRDGHIRHALVIAPKRVAELVWKQEAAGWGHTKFLKIAVLTGDPKERRSRLENAQYRDITVCGIDNVQWLAEQLEKLSPDHPVFDLLVLDETSRFKDPKSKRGRALRRLAGQFDVRWGLTGTPRPNSLADLWGPMQLITAGSIWPKSFYRWRLQHFYPTDYNGYNWAPLLGHAEQIMAEAAAYSLTLDEGDMPELPPISILVDQIELPGQARTEYNSMERRLFAAGDVVAANAAIATGKLAQIVNGYVYGEGGVDDVRFIHGAKQEWLQEKLLDLDGEPALIVYEYVEDIRIIQAVAGDIPILGRCDTGAVEAWNARKIPYLGLHPASGGHGLNLQAGGSRMLWISPPWSAEMWDQTIARLHRPGQAAHVMVHVCVARDTVDEIKRARVIDKLTAQQAFENYLRRRAGAAHSHAL